MTPLQNKIEEAKNQLRDKAQERFEEYADVMSEKTFTAFHRALQVYENELTSIATLAQEEARKETDDYRKIALLISSIFYYGNFKAETPNERELQSLLEKVNLWPTNEDLIVKRSNLSTLSNNTLQ